MTDTPGDRGDGQVGEPTGEPAAAGGDKPVSRRARYQGFLRRFFGKAKGSAKQILTAPPEPRIVPVPPVVVNSESKLLRYSPFSLGFFGALGVLVALGLARAVVQVQSVLVLVLLALFLALGLSPAVDFLTRRRLPRGVSVLIVAVASLGVISLGVTALVPILTEQTQLLAQNLPYLLDNLLQNPQLAQWNEQYKIVDEVQQFLTSGKLLQQLFGGIWNAGLLLANAMFSLIVTTVLTIYFLASLPTIKQAIYRLAPASRRDRARYLADEIFRGVSNYITGMFIIVTVASVSAFVFMNIVGLSSYSLALAFVVALFCFIPLVGSSLAMAAVAIVGFAVNPPIGVITIIYFLIYQQFDSYLLYPTVFRHTVKVPGALVVLSAIIGGMLLGVIGALIAIPTAAALLLLYREVLLPHLDAS
ncbi:MAG: AI-2E family transporter [Arachnia propionica]|nr:MAG: AI-2E family transporter [Arachnia propionica]